MSDKNKKKSTDKILFWIDAGLLHFGIAKHIQENFDAKLYAIYDLNHHLKKSFKKQKIVNFEKEWYFWEHVSDIGTEIDKDYLIKFEKKFQINLWQMAYAERVFFNDNPFYRFTHNEILSIFEKECKFFENILNEVKPDFLIIKTTDFHRNHLLAEMCRAIDVKILMLSASRLGYRSSISSQSDKIDLNLDENKNKLSFNSFNELREYLQKYNKLKQSKKIDSGGRNVAFFTKTIQSINWMLKTFDEEYKKDYVHFGVTRFRAIKEYLLILIKEKLRKSFIDKYFIKDISSTDKFVYFPLQVQPERNVDIDAPYYSNQIQVVCNIAKALPVDFKLYVKEHPNMNLRHWRSIEQYKEMLELPNVRLVHPSVDSKIVLEKCLLVISIAGTAGFEAAIYEKPSIVFSNAIYTHMPSVCRLKNFEELYNTIKESLQKKVDLYDVGEFINLLHRNSFEFDFFGNYQKIIDEFHGGGFLISNKISPKHLKSFFDTNKETYDFLAEQHIKKINQYKRLKIP